MADVYEGDRPYVFVSYAHVDSEVVLPIIEALDAAGYRLWYDEGIEWASEWPENIANHLYACSRFLAFMSHAAAVSDNCGDEIYYALNNRKPMLVAYIDDVELGEVNRGL